MSHIIYGGTTTIKGHLAFLTYSRRSRSSRRRTRRRRG